MAKLDCKPVGLRLACLLRLRTGRMLMERLVELAEDGKIHELRSHITAIYGPFGRM